MYHTNYVAHTGHALELALSAFTSEGQTLEAVAFIPGQNRDDPGCFCIVTKDLPPGKVTIEAEGMVIHTTLDGMEDAARKLRAAMERVHDGSVV